MSDILLPDDDFSAISVIAMLNFEHPADNIVMQNRASGQQRRLTFNFPRRPTADKTVVFIPSNGMMRSFDFSIFKVAAELKKKGFTTVVLAFGGFDERFSGAFDVVRTFSSVADFYEALQTVQYSHLFYRGWMIAYLFGAFLTKYFENTVVYMKDWNFSPRQEYEFFYGKQATLCDFAGIDFIFKHCKKILTPYAPAEFGAWAKEYNCSEGSFVFLPELCAEERYVYRPDVPYDKIKLVHAGSLPTTTGPSDFFPTKYMLLDAQKLTRKNIEVSFVVTEQLYNRIAQSRDMFSDILYEAEFNPNFKLKQGKDCDPSVLQEYHFGIFEFTNTTKYLRLINQAIPSKFAFYMEAGLPVMVNNRLEYLAGLVEKNDIGIVYSNEDIDRLDTVLAIGGERYKELVRNVETFRSTFTYESFGLSKLFE